MIPRFRPTVFLSDIRQAAGKKPGMESFEQRFAHFTGWKYGLFFPYGRAAAWSFFLANDVSDKEVIIPAYTCRAMVSAILGSNNRPVFVDGKENSVNMDDEAALDKITGNTGAICPTAMYGYPPDFSLYKDVRDEVLILADLALGLFMHNHSCALENVHAAFFSFGIGKQMTMLDGGMLCTNDAAIYRAVKSHRDIHFEKSKHSLSSLIKLILCRVCFSPNFYKLLYLVSEKTPLLTSLKGLDIGENKILPDNFHRMPSSFQIALGDQQLQRIDQARKKRQAIANRYDESLRARKLKRFKLLPPFQDCSHYPVLTDERDNLSHYLISRNIHATNIFKCPISELPMAEGFKDGKEYPKAENLAQRCLLLPFYDLMTIDEQDHVIQSLLEWDNMGDERGRLRRTWDALSQKYDRQSTDIADNAYFSWAMPEESDVILDVGCGAGTHMAMLSKISQRVYGIDLSLEMMKCAHKHGGGVISDMRILPFADNTFDYVLSHVAINYVADWSKAVSEMARVLKPDGTCVIAGANTYSFLSFVRCLLNILGIYKLGKTYHTSIQAISTVGIKHGLVVSKSTVNIKKISGDNVWSNFVYLLLTTMDKILSRPLSCWGGDAVVVFSKPNGP